MSDVSTIRILDKENEIDVLKIIKAKDYDVFDSRNMDYYALDKKDEAIMFENVPILKRVTLEQSIEEYASKMKRARVAAYEYEFKREELEGYIEQLAWIIESVVPNESKKVSVYCDVTDDMQPGSIYVTVRFSNPSKYGSSFPEKRFILDLYDEFDEFEQDIVDYLIKHKVEHIVGPVKEDLLRTKDMLNEYNVKACELLRLYHETNKYTPSRNMVEFTKKPIATYYTDELKIEFIEYCKLKHNFEDISEIRYAISLVGNDEYVERCTVASNIYDSGNINTLIWDTGIKDELLKVSEVSEVAKRCVYGASFVDLSVSLTEVAFILLSRYLNNSK